MAALSYDKSNFFFKDLKRFNSETSKKTIDNNFTPIKLCFTGG